MNGLSTQYKPYYTGPVYSEMFNDGNNEDKIKRYITNKNPGHWWLRDHVNSTGYFYYTSSGALTNIAPTFAYGIALSFCIGSITEEDKWEDVINAINKGTYKEVYAIGDEIPYTTTDGDTYHAVIAGFEVDVDESGNKIIQNNCFNEFTRY